MATLRDVSGSILPSFSGGKDSTYLVLRLHELGIKMESIAYFDTGWEFPEMEPHIAKVEDFLKQKIIRLKPREPFDNMFATRRVKSRILAEHGYGYGWPAMNKRWCTREKTRALDAHAAALSWTGIPLPITQCIGYAADELTRKEKHADKKPLSFQAYSYPMIDWGITEAQALAYCKERGFDWGGLYDIFGRVSCSICPLGGITSARRIYRNFPVIWQRMLEMESWLPQGHPGLKFTGRYTVSDLGYRFSAEIEEERMLKLPGLEAA